MKEKRGILEKQAEFDRREHIASYYYTNKIQSKDTSEIAEANWCHSFVLPAIPPCPLSYKIQVRLSALEHPEIQIAFMYLHYSKSHHSRNCFCYFFSCIPSA